MPSRLPADRLAAAGLALAFAPLWVLMAAVLGVYFRHMRVRGREHLRRGAVLVVANHPCTWVDAGVLDLALGRRLHFLTDEHLFAPRARGWFLGLYGAVPVWVRVQVRDRAVRNERTFARCEALFARGSAVAVFPEGVSATDRAVLPLHSGAARLALRALHDRGTPLTLLPVGLHYSDRTAFRSEVTASIGAPIPCDDLAPGEVAPDLAESLLTTRIANALSGLTLDLAAHPAAEPLSLVEPLAVRRGVPALERLQALAGSLDARASSDPGAQRRFERHARAWRRACRALRVEANALSPRRPPRPDEWPALRATIAILELLPATVGVVLHALPVALVEGSARAAAREPSHVALARITAAVVWLPLWYLVLAWAMIRSGWNPGSTVTVLALMAASGALAWDGWRLVRRGWERAWLAWVSRRHPRLVERARSLQAELVDELESLGVGKAA